MPVLSANPTILEERTTDNHSPSRQAMAAMSDNGTQFKSAIFDEFKAKYGFEHTTSSPHHHQANAAVESAVQISKRILKQEDPFLALMAYPCNPYPSHWKDTIRADHGKTDTYYPPKNYQGLSAKDSRSCSSQES